MRWRLLLIALAGCSVDVTQATGGDSEGNSASNEVTGGPIEMGTSPDTQEGSADAADSDGSDSGSGPTDPTGNDDGGVQGEECDVTQQGLCEDPGVTVHCYSGSPETCNVGECTGGTQTCDGFDLDLGNWSECTGEVVPQREVCDGLDNDCDGEVDEDLGQARCGEGPCAHVEDLCVAGAPHACDPTLGAEDEVCDGVDNDCDGDVDEDFAGQETSCGVGQCEHMVAACDEGVEPTCDPLAGATSEDCDGVDNDCDGDTDEGFGLLTCGVGECEHSVAACDEGAANVCDPWEGAGDEACDGLDNDCDGDTDEGFAPVTCGLGVCEHSEEQCIDGSPNVCNPLQGASPEVCNDGLDNNCDGSIDNNCCGNGSIEGGEECDGASLGATCVSLGHDGGSLTCNANCTHNESACTDCGDGNADPGESCDGADLNGSTCVSLGHDGGTLTCNANCTYNQNGCSDCGDGNAEGSEQCDGGDLDGESCVSLGHDGGSLSCNANCTFNQNGCVDCGDGNAEGSEECDGADLDGASCVTLGHDGGTLTCAANCQYNENGCTDCGDNNAEGNEDCDGNDLDGQTCLTLGYDGGTLDCNGDCTFDPSMCFACASLEPGFGLAAGPPLAAPGDCANVIDTLTCSSTNSGTVLDAAGDVDGPYSCGEPFAPLDQPENEDIYAFTCQADGDVDLLLSDMDCDLDIYVLDDMCDPDGGCLEGSTEANTVNDQITFSCTAGETYFIVIEGYGWQPIFPPGGRCGAGEGNYTLEFATGDATGGCLEDCDDGVDNDIDGDIDCADTDCAEDPVCNDPCG